MTTFGAIRWDAWYGAAGSNDFPIDETAWALSTPEFSGRAPAHSVIEGSTTVVYADSQATFDAEITAAKEAGLSYWAYLRYSASHLPSLNRGWDYHQASSIKSDMNWAVMTQTYLLGSTGDYATEVAEHVAWFQQSNYQKVLTDRPLVYLFYDAGQLASSWGGDLANFKAALDALRVAAVGAGLGDPYIAVNSTSAIKTSLGLDALFTYAARPVVMHRSPYADLSAGMRDVAWPAQAATGSKFIPLAMMGWDKRPRQQRLDKGSRQAGDQPYVGLDQRHLTATPEEIVAHVEDAFDYVAANPSICDADTVLAYAWSEYDEGGWLGPTLDGSGQARLSALAEFLT